MLLKYIRRRPSAALKIEQQYYISACELFDPTAENGKKSRRDFIH